MWVLYDDFTVVTDPSDSFIEALTIMDAFVTRTQEERLFLDVRSVSGEVTELYVDDPKVLEADFDYTTGQYNI